VTAASAHGGADDPSAREHCNLAALPFFKIRMD
jgi:hypothetical protein